MWVETKGSFDQNLHKIGIIQSCLARGQCRIFLHPVCGSAGDLTTSCDEFFYFTGSPFFHKPNTLASAPSWNRLFARFFYIIWRLDLTNCDELIQNGVIFTTNSHRRARTMPISMRATSGCERGASRALRVENTKILGVCNFSRSFLVLARNFILKTAHHTGILLANASQYLPDGFLWWMLLGASNLI